MSAATKRIRRLLPIVLALAAILALGVGTLPTLAQSALAPITITISDNGYEAPDTLPSGQVAITYVNEGTQPHQAQILQLEPGVTMDQLAAAGQKVGGDNTTGADAQAFFALLKGGGGTNELAPGESATVVNNLMPGNAVLIDFTGPEEQPFLQPIGVTEASVQAPASAANVDVSMVDDAFQMPDTIPAGTDTFKVTNTGQDFHEFDLLYVGSHTLADVQAALTSPQPPDWAVPAGGAGALAPGDTAYVTEDIQPGNYVALCGVPDPETGMPHFLMGMITLFAATAEGGPASAQPPTAAASQAQTLAATVSSAGSAFTVTLPDSGVIQGLPDTLPPGPTQITFVNAGTQPQNAFIFQPNPGVTVDQLKALGNSQEDFVKFLSLITAYSGADDLPPGMSENVTINLDPGSYIMANMDSETPQPGFFQVSGDPTGAHAPLASYDATEFDDGSTFRFDLPATVAPGVNTIKVTNAGTQQHEFELVYIGGHTLADVQAALQQQEPPDWAMPAGGLQAQEPGMTSWLTVDFQPGNYAVLCFMPDPKTGQPHADLGMAAVITVP